jgi:hypothetical protein
MCAIILKSNKESSKLPIKWTAGIDIRKNLIDGKTTFEILESNGGENDIRKQWWRERCYDCGSKFFFKGKIIQSFVCCSPKASISSQLLSEMLEQWDHHSLGLFDRSDGSTPFLLLDGNFSRFQLPFLEYVNGCNHKWKVCIGVPYGTHLWQVHDASSKNGCFKMNLTKAKERYIEERQEFKFVTSDIVPLVNMCFHVSFGRV